MSEPTPGPLITLEPDVYGSKARTSCLADWMEVAALTRRRVTREDLAELLADNAWTSIRPRQYDVPPEEEPPEDWAEAAFTVLGQRLELLGPALWPFELDESTVRAARGASPATERYLALLGLTVAHAWKLPHPHRRPTDLLEDIVLRAYQHSGCRAFGTGTAGATGGRGAATVVAAGIGVGLRPVLRPQPIARSARDAGVDVLAVATPHDSRRGQVVLLVQATCARSDRWEGKLSGPRGDLWATYLNDPRSRPLAVLAVPHHVEAETLTSLTGANGGGMVVDRLRLVRMLDGTPLTSDEAATVALLRTVGVDDGRAAATRY